MAIRGVIPPVDRDRCPLERHEAELETMRAIYGLAMHINESVVNALGQKLDQFDIYAISALARRGALSQGDLAQAIGKSSVFVTRLVDDLEKAGLAERGAHRFDRRVNVVQLTLAGREAYDRMKARADELAEDLFRDMADDRLELLLENLRRMSARTGFSLSNGLQDKQVPQAH